jgi:hypothetical protein
MSYHTTVRLDACALWAPGAGYLHGTLGLTGEAARLRLVDRKANGEAFPGERVRRMTAQLTVSAEGVISGWLTPVEPMPTAEELLRPDPCSCAPDCQKWLPCDCHEPELGGGL